MPSSGDSHLDRGIGHFRSTPLSHHRHLHQTRCTSKSTLYSYLYLYLYLYLHCICICACICIFNSRQDSRPAALPASLQQRVDSQAGPSSGEEGEEGIHLFIFSYLHTSYKPLLFILHTFHTSSGEKGEEGKNLCSKK